MRAMMWCLAETHRSKVMQVWAHSKASTTLLQDGRKGRLTVRFVTCNGNLERRSGYLGTANLAKDVSLDSIGIQNGSVEVFEKLALQNVIPLIQMAKDKDSSTWSCILPS